MKDDIDLRMVAIIIDGGLLDCQQQILPQIAGLDCWIAGLPDCLDCTIVMST